MNTRNDFMPNPSSRCFVLARRKDCTLEMVYDLLNTDSNREDIKNSWEFESLGNTHTVDQIIQEIAEMLFSPHRPEMQLDGWLVCAEEYSSEGECEIESIFCNYIEISDNDMFKAGSFS